MSNTFHSRNSLRRQRRALSLWLRERELDLSLCDSNNVAPRSAARAPGQPDPAAGDIRLLPPGPVSEPASERPVYVLVLGPVGEASFNVAPFSRFSVPATPQEWATGLPVAALRVLCLWNMRTVSSDVVAGAWRVRVMPADKMRRALRAAQAASPNRASMCTCAANVGPPLLHPRDPRFQYISEEGLLLDELLGDMNATRADEPLLYKIPEADMSQRLAADRRSRYRTRPARRPKKGT